MSALRRPHLARSAAVMALAGVLVVACGDDSGGPTAERADAVTTSIVVADTTPVTDTTPVDDTTPVATDVAPTEPPTTPASTTVDLPTGWTSVDSFPTLAYLPCCASNWWGSPSPDIPADPSAVLAPGIYFARRVDGDVSTQSVTFTVARFEACSVLPEGWCEYTPDTYAPDEMGVTEPVREITLPLDATVRVGLSGFECEADARLATGADLAPLMAAFDAAYAQVIGAPVTAGATTDAIAAAVGAEPAAGFSVPACGLAYPPGTLVWQGADGPGVLLQSLLAFDDATDSVVVPPSASAEWIRLTAIEIGTDGVATLYFYAGYYS